MNNKIEKQEIREICDFCYQLLDSKGMFDIQFSSGGEAVLPRLYVGFYEMPYHLPLSEIGYNVHLEKFNRLSLIYCVYDLMHHSLPMESKLFDNYAKLTELDLRETINKETAGQLGWNIKGKWDYYEDIYDDIRISVFEKVPNELLELADLYDKYLKNISFKTSEVSIVSSYMSYRYMNCTKSILQIFDNEQIIDQETFLKNINAIKEQIKKIKELDLSSPHHLNYNAKNFEFEFKAAVGEEYEITSEIYNSYLDDAWLEGEDSNWKQEAIFKWCSLIEDIVNLAEMILEQNILENQKRFYSFCHAYTEKYVRIWEEYLETSKKVWSRDTFETEILKLIFDMERIVDKREERILDPRDFKILKRIYHSKDQSQRIPMPVDKIIDQYEDYSSPDTPFCLRLYK